MFNIFNMLFFIKYLFFGVILKILNFNFIGNTFTNFHKKIFITSEIIRVNLT